MLVFDEEVDAAAESFLEDIASRYQQESQNSERPILPPDKIFLDTDDLNNITKRFTQIHISNLKTNSDLDFIEYDSSMPISIPIDARSKKPIKLFNHFLNEFKGRVLIAAETKGRLETIT